MTDIQDRGPRVHRIEVAFDFTDHKYKITGSNIEGFTRAAHNLSDLITGAAEDIRRMFDNGAAAILAITYNQAAGPVRHGHIVLGRQLKKLDIAELMGL